MVDALRGVALAGVLLVNAEAHFRTNVFDALVYADPPSSGADRAVAVTLDVGVEWTALSFFCLLFGAGLAAQRERAGADHGAFVLLALRRHFALFALGVAHMVLLFAGDILALYAIVGLLVVLALRLPARAWLVVGTMCLALRAVELPLHPFSSMDDALVHVEAARRVSEAGRYAQVVRFRAHELRPYLVLLLRVSPHVAGVSLLGAWAYHAKVFDPLSAKRLRVALVTIGLAAFGVRVVVVASGAALAARETVASTAGAAMALGLSAALAHVCSRDAFARAVAFLAPVGRMTLTLYLTQSLALALVFHGYGLGRLGHADRVETLGWVALVFGVQFVAARAWLARHRHGPFEALTRRVTYGR